MYIVATIQTTSLTVPHQVKPMKNEQTQIGNAVE